MYNGYYPGPPPVLEIICTDTAVLVPDTSGIIKLQIGPRCCNDSCATGKIVNSLDSAPGSAYASSFESLEHMITASSDVYTAFMAPLSLRMKAIDFKPRGGVLTF